MKQSSIIHYQYFVVIPTVSPLQYLQITINDIKQTMIYAYMYTVYIYIICIPSLSLWIYIHIYTHVYAYISLWLHCCHPLGYDSSINLHMINYHYVIIYMITQKKTELFGFLDPQIIILHIPKPLGTSSDDTGARPLPWCRPPAASARLRSYGACAASCASGVRSEGRRCVVKTWQICWPEMT